MAMKSSEFFFTLVLIISMSTAIVSLATPTMDEETHVNTKNHNSTSPSLHGSRTISRFLAVQVRATMTCDRSPRVCRAKSSPGPDCCNKQCVDVMKDTNNCGMCGRKCNYSELCCKGNCVDSSVDERYCGSCDTRCPTGSLCLYGLCSYA